MIELWYDDKTMDDLRALASESPDLLIYNYGEDLQVLRERIAELEAKVERLVSRGIEDMQYRIAELEATLTDTKIELGISHKIIKQGGANTAAEAAYIFDIPPPPIDTGSEV